MVNIILGAVVGIAYLVYRIIYYNRQKKTIEELTSGSKYECLNYSKVTSIIIGLSILLPIGSLIYSLGKNDNDLTAIALAMIFMFAAEFYNALMTLKFYYNDKGCIINGKVVLYKSIKTIIKRFGNPLGRHTIITFNNDKLNLFRAPVNVIVSKTNLKVLK